jgi:hypothetical protein
MRLRPFDSLLEVACIKLRGLVHFHVLKELRGAQEAAHGSTRNTQIELVLELR